LLSDEQEQHAASGVAALFADTERRFSRFPDDSELAALNRALGPQRVSPRARSSDHRMCTSTLAGSSRGARSIAPPRWRRRLP
jgi:hypothetical protein